MENINIKSLGPIHSADIDFGDLTFFIGPQASGKGILLQMIKLLVDGDVISETLKQYGYILGIDSSDILDRYFGEGISGIWNSKTKILLDGQPYKKRFLIGKDPGSELNMLRESLYYVPAQRVLCLENGWPRFFTDYDDSVPFVLRYFSETLRQFLESIANLNNVIFPMNKELSAPLRESFNKSIFHNGKFILDQSVKKRFKLNIGNSSIPYMAWSAGQKEFMPLLLSFYWLCPPNKTGRVKGIRYVIVEEPEMGLHPEGIQSVILQIIDLMSRGYKVIISTHSPVLLEFAWAYHYLKQMKEDNNLFAELFGLKNTHLVEKLFEDILRNKTIKTYYFDRQDENVIVKDISSLDAGCGDQSTAEWGGLSSFSSKASDIISKIMAKQ